MTTVRYSTVEGVLSALVQEPETSGYLSVPSAQAAHRFNVRRCVLLVLESGVASDVGLVSFLRHANAWCVCVCWPHISPMNLAGAQPSPPPPWRWCLLALPMRLCALLIAAPLSCVLRAL